MSRFLPALCPTAPTSGTTETTPERRELPGVSTMRWDSINEAQRHGYYYGDHVAVIAGNSWDYGEDAGEIVIHDPIVIEILA